ncbi:hypothetical protein NDI43_12260 [Microcoleus vaginatus GB2-A3]
MLDPISAKSPTVATALDLQAVARCYRSNTSTHNSRAYAASRAFDTTVQVMAVVQALRLSKPFKPCLCGDYAVSSESSRVKNFIFL